MILNDIWSIEEISGGFVLIEKRTGHVRKDGKLTDKTKVIEDNYYYGCVYQALIGFLQKLSIERDIDDLRTKVEEIIKIIKDAEIEIKKKFCIEVLVSGREIQEESIEKA